MDVKINGSCPQRTFRVGSPHDNGYIFYLGSGLSNSEKN